LEEKASTLPSGEKATELACSAVPICRTSLPVATSQRHNPQPAPEQAIVLPSGENAT